MPFTSMVEDITLRLRSRWQTIFVVTLMLLAISPTPLHRRWVSAINSGSIALQAGRVDHGLEEIEAALAAEPALARLHLLASDLAYHLEEYDRSLEHLYTAQQSFQESEIGLCRSARDEFIPDLNKPPDALWQRLVRECPFAYQQARDLILETFENNPDSRVLPYLETLHDVRPQDSQIWSAYARLLSVQDPDQAEQHLRALSNLQAGAFELERDILRAIRESSGEESRAFTLAQIGQVFARYQIWSLAALAFEESVSEDNDYADALAYLGLALERLGENGFDSISSAIRANPQDPRAHVFMAIHYQKRGEIEAARDALDRAASLDPENPAIAAQLGSVYAQIGDYSAAAQAYLAATELAPDDARFWLLLAGFSLEHDLDLDGIGLPAARNAISVDPQNSQGYEMLGTIQFNLEEFMLAERSLQIALALDQRSPAAQYNYGLLMLAFGRRQAAEAAFTAASIMDEGGEYAEMSVRFLSR